MRRVLPLLAIALLGSCTPRAHISLQLDRWDSGVIQARNDESQPIAVMVTIPARSLLQVKVVPLR